MSLSPEKALAFETIDNNRDAVATLSDSIFYFGELGLQEYETMGLMSGLLEEEGFTVTRGLSGFDTAFLATWGEGAPVIALHTEYDSNPDNSQVSGVTEPRPIVDGAPGHCEGHNCNGAVLVSSGIAIKRAMEKYKIPGTLRLIGAPAEEQLLSRPYFVRDGMFDDVDVAFHTHLGGDFIAQYGLTHAASVSATFTFHGESSHAATAPWNGRDALDGVVLMDMGMAQYREHMQPTNRVHRVITDGGKQPNVIPSRATVWWYFRDPTAAGAQKLFEQAKKIAEGAAMMTNTTVTVEVLSAVWPVRGNETLARVLQENIELIGMPEWTQEEQAMARALQQKAGVPVDGLRTKVLPLTGPAPQRAPSNDCGDVSWKVPMGRYAFPANVPNVPFHHWSAGVVLATPIAHKGTVAGAKALAGAVVDLFKNPARVEEAKATFSKELGGITYEPLLPASQTPPFGLNREAMEAWRPKMRPHYVKERPVFKR